MALPDAQRWAALGPRIDELLALDTAAREGRLQAIEAEEPDLGAELRTLLGALADASALPGLGADAAPAPRPGAQRGEVFGAWRLVEPIGAGGMGSVWRARRADGRYDRDVAIKLLHSGLGDARAQERFRREGAMLARLQHPGIAQLVDAGVDAQGRPYLVLEHVQGEPIDRWCRDRQLGVKATLELFLQVLQAVSAAHAQLVIHRDLKPSNILVDEAGRVRLLDFGIARLQDDADAALTREGALALTPRYAAPEQFDGSGAPLSVATDVFALGVLLHELLTGQHPSGLPPHARPLEHLKAIAQAPWAPASQAVPPPRRRELRGDIDAILAQAMAPQPGSRYASVAALADDVRRHLRFEPIAARVAGPGLRFVRLVRRHPLEFAVAGVALLAIPSGHALQFVVFASIALGAGLALWQARRARVEAAAARAGQARADAVKNFIASAFEQAVPREGTGGVVTAADLLQSAVDRVATELRSAPAVAAELMAIAGESFLHLGDVPAAHRVLPDAVRRCEASFGTRHAITLAVRRAAVQAHNVMGEIDASERLLPGLLADLRAAMPASARNLVPALRSASFVHTKRGREAAAVAALHEAVAIAHEHLGEADDDTLGAAGLLGNTLNTFARYDEALAALDGAVAIARRVHGAQRPHLMLSQLEGFRAEVLVNQGQGARAVDELRQVLADQLALDGADTARNRYTRYVLGRALADAGRLDEALATVDEAIAIDLRLVPRPTADKAAMHTQRALLLAELGRVDAARAAIELADELVAAAGSAQVSSQLARRAARARIDRLAGRPEAALTLASAVLDDPALVAPAVRVSALRTRVCALADLGRIDEAKALAGPLLAQAGVAGPKALAQARSDLAALDSRTPQARG